MARAGGCGTGGVSVSDPLRLQRRRTKGWRAPEGAVCVTRPGMWGNPFGSSAIAPIAVGSAAEAVRLFADLVQRERWDCMPLAGRSLLCWCRLCPDHAAGKPFDARCEACEPCHADVLGCVANGLRCEVVNG